MFNSQVKMMRWLLILPGFALTIIWSTKVRSYQWPLYEFNKPHRVTATYGECRGDRNHFHRGIDVHDVNTSNVPVYPVEDGIVKKVGTESVDIEDAWGNYYRYIHLRNIPNNIGVDSTVHAGQDVLGYIATENSTHLHFQDGEDGYEWNPLFFLDPFEDTAAPTIDYVRIVKNETTEQFSGDTIFGKVDIIVKATENTSYPGGTDPNNGVFKVKYQTPSSGGWVENLVFDFCTACWNVKKVYADGSDTYKYIYVATNYMDSDGYWDTQDVADGDYYIYVKVEDTKGNPKQASRLVHVLNNPPGIPEPFIRVTYPNGGETWIIGETYTITWNHESVSWVDIKLYRNGSWETIKENIPCDGSEPWTVTSPSATDCRIKILDSSDPSVYDISDGPFTITYPPGGGPGGCPYVYTWDGKEFVENNTILPACEIISGIVTDFYKIERPLKIKDGKYVVELREFESEHTYLDKIELLAVDHPKGIDVGVTPNGKILCYADRIMPISCVDNYGVNWLDSIATAGHGHYRGKDGDWLDVDFGNVGSGNYGVITPMAEKPEGASALAVEDGEGKNLGIVYPRGKSSVSLVDASSYKPDGNFKIRLRCIGEINLDYIALVKLHPIAVRTRECALESAIHCKDGSVRSDLLLADGNYAELVPGDTIMLIFDATELQGKWARDFILVSKGYYITEKKLVRSGIQTAEYGNLPFVFRLESKPNTFTSNVLIEYTLTNEVEVNLTIYDVTGRIVKNLVNGEIEAGYHSVNWDAKDLPSGIYFVKLQVGEFTETRKLVLMK